MRIVRWAAAAVTILMSLMNLPFAFDDGGADLAAPPRWAITVLGVVGIVAAVGLLRRAAWGRPALLTVGAVNLVGAVIAVATQMQGAFIGLTVSALIVVLGALARDGERTRVASPSVA